MLRPFAVCAVLSFTVACSEPAAPAAPKTAAPAPLTSGLDAATFDKAVRPQDDLYRYVNGGWMAKTEIPADKATYGGFVEAYDRTQEQLRVLVEAVAKTPAAAGTPQQKIGDFFVAFMDDAKADSARHHAAGRGVRAHRRAQDEERPGDLLRAPVEARDRRVGGAGRRGGRCAGADALGAVRVAGRYRPARTATTT